MFERRASTRPGLQRLRARFVQHKYWLILLSRFIWGLRLATVRVASMSGTRPLVFCLLDLLGAVLWAVTLALAGYYFGHMFHQLVDAAQGTELWMAVALFVLISVLVWRVAHRRRHKAAQMVQLTG